MENNTKIEAVLDQLIENQIAFACWYYPKDSRLGLIVGDESDVIFFNRFDQLNGEEGFVFAPFRITANSPVILIKSRLYFDDFKSGTPIDFSQFKPFELSSPQQGYINQSKDEYLALVDKTVGTIREGTLSKVIISRQIPVLRNSDSLGTMFQQLHYLTPNAFAYLVNLPRAGTWMGATPEVLVQTVGDKFETVSLAGTQVRKWNDEEYFWSTKDIEEQAFVSRYMLDVFFNFDIHQYKTVGPETMESGRVAHLKTSFFFQTERIKDCLGNFIAELHPTPAVCGLPKEQADEYIRTNEPYDRRYYTGYLGPWRLGGTVSLFVNLRCMEILPEEYILYAGGGITARSVAEKEWDETNQKARTLLSVIQTDIE